MKEEETVAVKETVTLDPGAKGPKSAFSTPLVLVTVAPLEAEIEVRFVNRLGSGSLKRTLNASPLPIFCITIV